MLSSHNDVLRTNKLEKVMKLVFSLDELDNSNNLKDGMPSNTYYVTSPEYSTCFEPITPQYKKLKSGMINSVTLKITDQADNVITNGPGTNVVLHICDHKL